MAKIEPSRLLISVIIPVHDGGEAFRRCLTALAQTDPAPGEILVVVDGDAGNLEQVDQAFDIRVLHTPFHGGPAQARNLGARAARGNILFFVDADVLVPPDIMAQIATIFSQAPDLAAVFGSYDDAPAAPNFLSQYRNLLHHYVHQTANEEASTFWAGCGAIRRGAFFDAGGFDTGYDRPAIEDIELGYQLKRIGHRIRLCKTLQVKHLKRWTALPMLKADFFYRALPWTDLILRHGRMINDLNLRYTSRISVMLTLGFLCAVLAAGWWPGLLAIAGAAAFLLLVLNAPLYRFLLQRRGLWFALQTIPWHWLYYFYSGLAFACGVVRHSWRSKIGRKNVVDTTDESW